MTKKRAQRRGKRRSQLEKRVTENIQEKSAAAAEAVGEETEEKRSNGTHRERDENRLGDGGHFRLKLRRDRADAENQNEEIEGVERPAKEAREKGIALRRRQRAEVAEETGAAQTRRRRLGRRCVHCADCAFDCGGIDFGSRIASVTRATCTISATS